MLEGCNSVLEALKAGRPLHKIFLARDNDRVTREIKTLAAKQKVMLQLVDKQRIEQLAATGNHQGVVAQAAQKEYLELAELIDLIRNKKSTQEPLLLLLDGIEDPHNLGALIRSAEAVGASGVVIPKHRAVGLTAAVSKASAGAIEHIPVARVTNMAHCIDELKQNGFWVTGADPDSSLLYSEADLTGPRALVIGGEGKGIRRLVKEKCDVLVKIPLRGRINSLNASVAGALLLYEADRQRYNE